MSRATLIAAALVATVALAHAEPPHYSIETDLGTATVFRGVALAGGVRIDRWRMRAGALYQQIPTAFLEMDARDKGWQLSQEQLVVAGDYFLGGGRSAWFVDAAATFGRFAMTSPDQMHVTAYAPGFVAGGGYQWYPFAGNNLFVEPWAFLIVAAIPAVAGGESVGGQSFHHPPVIPGAWVSIGYTF